MDPAPEIATPPNPAKRRKFSSLVIVASALLIGLLFLDNIFRVRVPVTDSYSSKSIDGSKLRIIGHAILSSGSDNSEGILPLDDSLNQSVININTITGRIRTIYTVALTLAQADDGMNNSMLWFSRLDAIYPSASPLPAVLDSAYKGDKRTAPINPKFANAPLAFAVAIFPPGKGRTSLPATTPLAWTRGLQPDGTWSKTHGTYGDWGGHIVFMGGNVEKFKSIDGKLVKFGTNEPTSNILEALPPGSRISEFTPPKK